jgi:integrase/recombinase XerD
MKFSRAIDVFIADGQRAGQFNSPHTIMAYRDKLERLADHVSNRDPRTIGRDEVKAFLGNWHGNSQRQAHAILASFFDFAMEEGWRKDNPARQVRRTKARKPAVYRLTRGEVVALLDASQGRRRDRWAAHLGCCAGLRAQEITGMQGRHFARSGFVWVSADVGKGNRERWIPIVADLADVVEEINALVTAPDEYVLPGRRSLNPPDHTLYREHPTKRLSYTALYRQIVALGAKAGIAARVTPHTMRHAYGDHIARYAGLRAAQALMGHASVETTAGTYVDRPTLDELAVSVRGFSYYPTRKEVETPDGTEDAR